MKSLQELGFENIEKIKARCAEMNRFIEHIDENVSPKTSLDFGLVKVGETAFNFNGIKPGIVEEIVGDSVTIHGRFHRLADWKPTPWSQDEIDELLGHSKGESERVRQETRRALETFNQRENLAKQFKR